MPLGFVVIFAALQGLAEGLGVSASGHAAALAVWITPSSGARSLAAFLDAGTAVALLFATRRRFVTALTGGFRAIARPALFGTAARDAAVLVTAVIASVVAGLALAPDPEAWHGAPLMTGLGLLAGSLALASTEFAPKPHRDMPTIAGAWLAGAAHGLAMFPGASRIGAILVVLVWMGIHAERAVEIAALVTVPSLLISAARGARGATALGAGTLAAGLVIALVAALAGNAMVRALAAKRRVSALALWLFPLGLAMVAYARALPR